MTILLDNAYDLFIGIVASALIIIAVGIFAFRKKKPNISYAATPLIEALGGAGNITSAEARGSRVSVVIVDTNLIKKDHLTAVGVISYVLMTGKILLLLQTPAAIVASAIEASLIR